MSKIVSGQMRVVDKSSISEGQFHKATSKGRGKLKGVIPDMKLQQTLNPKKESSHRGKGKGKKGDIDASGSRHQGVSSFTEAVSFQSVGGMKLVSANIERIVAKVETIGKSKKPEISRKGGKDRKQAIKKPDKKGKKDDAGKKQPAKVGNKPPTKSSDLIKKQGKKVIKQVKKLAKGKRGRPKKSMVNDKHNSAHLKE